MLNRLEEVQLTYLRDAQPAFSNGVLSQDAGWKDQFFVKIYQFRDSAIDRNCGQPIISGEIGEI
ncbi:MAG: hypothetical protein QM496_13310 [Verrucomicrobiota bacterium]